MRYEQEPDPESYVGRSVVSAELFDEDRYMEVVFDDGRKLTIKALAYDDAWLVLSESLGGGAAVEEGTHYE